MKSPFLKGLEEKLVSLIEPLVTESGCDLVELQLVQRKSNGLLRILIDKPGGVTISDCASISREISFKLEVDDPIENRYTLEVSSPGLDRPLTTHADFKRKLGESVKLSLRDSEGRNFERVGSLIRVEDGSVVLQTAEGEESWLLADIVKGKIVF